MMIHWNWGYLCLSQQTQANWDCTNCSCAEFCDLGINNGLLCSEQFTCPNSGCVISKTFLNDGHCDCPIDCADETDTEWSCENCACDFGCGLGLIGNLI